MGKRLNLENLMNYLTQKNVGRPRSGFKNAIEKTYNPKTEEMNNSLEALDRLYKGGEISEKKYNTLRKQMYSQYKEYLSFAASIIFLFSGFLFLTPSLTGFSVIENISKFKLNIIGVICFLLGISFLGIFIRKILANRIQIQNIRKRKK